MRRLSASVAAGSLRPDYDIRQSHSDVSSVNFLLAVRAFVHKLLDIVHEPN
jgi:hypothetical protein